MTPEGAVTECDTFKCWHCQAIVFVRAATSLADMGGWCGMCAKAICRHCAGKDCTPFERRLERAEKRAASLRSMGF